MSLNFISSNPERTALLEWAIQEHNKKNFEKSNKIFEVSQRLLNRKMDNGVNEGLYFNIEDGGSL